MFEMTMAQVLAYSVMWQRSLVEVNQANISLVVLELS